MITLSLKLFELYKMKAKLFIAALLLVPLLAGCNKDESLDYNKLIVGEWRRVYAMSEDENGIYYEEFEDENEEYPGEWKFDENGFWYEMNNGGEFNVFELAGKYSIKGDTLTTDWSLSSYGGGTMQYQLEFSGKDIMKVRFTDYYEDDEGNHFDSTLQEFERIK